MVLAFLMPGQIAQLLELADDWLIAWRTWSWPAELRG